MLLLLRLLLLLLLLLLPLLKSSEVAKHADAALPHKGGFIQNAQLYWLGGIWSKHSNDRGRLLVLGSVPG